DIELTTFGFETDPGDAVQFSPDGNYLAVYAERGRLDLNRPEDSLRFYRTRDIESFLKNSDEEHLPTPVWMLALSTASTSPIISRWRWLSDSSAIAFLQSVAGGKKQLALANLKKKTVEQLRPPTEERRDEEDIRDFDIRDRQH